MSDDPAPQKFRLTPINWVCVVFAFLAVFTVHVAEGEASREVLSSLALSLFLVVALPLIIGSIAYQITKEPKFSHRLVNAGVLITFGVSSFIFFQSAAQKREEFAANPTSTPAGTNASDTAAMSEEEDAPVAREPRKEDPRVTAIREQQEAQLDSFYGTMEAFTQENIAQEDAWEASAKTIEAPEILSYRQFSKPGELKRQALLFREHIEKTKAYATFVNEADSRLRKGLTRAGFTSDFIESASRDFRDENAKDFEVRKDLLKAHIAYAEAGYAILEILARNPDAWQFNQESGEMGFNDETVMTNFNSAIRTYVDRQSAVIEATNTLNQINR